MALKLVLEAAASPYMCSRRDAEPGVLDLDLFIAIHRWNEKDQGEVLGEAMKVFVAADRGKYKGAKLVGTYSAYLEQPISWCVWEAENKEVLHGILDKIPKVETEIIPVVQLYKTED